ncbi:PD-(D/E)XK nuclease family protein [Zobellia sp. B3R18]|uniref:PD-(D/E)XK nuclease family protein n=1 Tax=Zobellia sp. B3R18 TaxID=2841568 RepID=UPI001C06A186|nr:PD-(D/E)XK nuclease family protein [Zobellia sp. B3R18]MBU2973279.1 PD-(D/E)XK nuclease family protein [Zobellia sp. B3R18]
MFNSLYKLYRNNSIRHPLEDFNTESFAGILKMHPDICAAFCSGFLNLPEEEYSVDTQYFQSIPNDSNCFIDLVFIGDTNVCFVENKVESSEGDKQLERYVKALIKHHDGKGKYLRYCTKYSDPKDNIKGICKANVDFSQFRWYEVANFLKTYQNEPVVKLYLEFLKEHKMAQDNTLKSDNLIAMESMRKTIEIVEFHIENSKPEFTRRFGKVNYNKNFNWDQIRNHNRIVYSVEKVLLSKTGKLSELLYGIEFDNLKMFTRVLVDKEHEHYKTFVSLQHTSNFKMIEYDIGTVFQLEEDLGRFLNNVNADKEIQDWFTSSFEKLNDFISQNKQLSWNFIDN